MHASYGQQLPRMRIVMQEAAANRTGLWISMSRRGLVLSVSRVSWAPPTLQHCGPAWYPAVPNLSGSRWTRAAPGLAPEIEACTTCVSWGRYREDLICWVPVADPKCTKSTKPLFQRPSPLTLPAADPESACIMAVHAGRWDMAMRDHVQEKLHLQVSVLRPAGPTIRFSSADRIAIRTRRLQQ